MIECTYCHTANNDEAQRCIKCNRPLVDNNVEQANAKLPSQSVVDVVRIFDHQKDADELILDREAYFPVEPEGKAGMTWGQVKSLY